MEQNWNSCDDSTRVSLNAVCWRIILWTAVAAGRLVPRARTAEVDGTELLVKMTTGVFDLTKGGAKDKKCLFRPSRAWLEVWPMSRGHDVWQMESGAGCPTKLTSYSR